MVSLDEWRGFEEVQACLTACGKPRRGFPLADDNVPNSMQGLEEVQRLPARLDIGLVYAWLWVGSLRGEVHAVKRS